MSSLEHSINSDDQLFFMHVPKTAGTTLNQIIEQKFDQREIAPWPFRFEEQPSAFFTSYRYFHGHIDYPAMCSRLLRTPVAITMLRHPVERYLSHFGNRKRVSSSVISEWSADQFEEFKRISLPDFVCRPTSGLLDEACSWLNRQARMLVGRTNSELVSPRTNSHGFIEATTPDKCDPDLAQAKNRLESLAFFGITERFQESLFLLSYTFGWIPVLEYQSFNQAAAGMRPHQNDLPIAVLATLHELNRIDIQLYEYGVRLFQLRYDQMCAELLDRYAGKIHTRVKVPLAPAVIGRLLEFHYAHRFAERNEIANQLRLTFDQKLSGENWQVREMHAVHGVFRWSGPGRCSKIDIPLAATSPVRLRISIVLAITDTVLDNLQLRVNNHRAKMVRHRAANDSTICEAYLPQHLLAGSFGRVRISLEIKDTFRPIDVMPGSRDDRSLGIAVNWIEVEAVTPITLARVQTSSW